MIPAFTCRRPALQKPLCAAVLCGCLTWGTVQAAEPDYLRSEAPVEDSVLKLKDIIGRGLQPAVKAARRAVRLLPDGLDPFWQNSTLNLKPRTYYFDRRRDNTTDSRAWAAGGALEYRSGLWQDRVSFGTTVFTTQKLYGPHDRSGSGLLKPVQEGFTVLGEAYLDIRIADENKLRLFRQSLNLPYVNKHDIRMIPNMFEALTITNGEDPRFNYIAGHVEQIKQRDSDKFIHMSEAAGAEGSKKGLSMAGARFALSDKVHVGAISHYSWDVFNTFFAEADGGWALSDRLAVRLSGQFTDQRSVGDELVGSFDTYNVGLRVAASYGGGVLTLAYSHTDNGAGIRNPYGGFPGYISIIVQDFNRAGEDAWLIGVSYDFKHASLPGFSGFVNFASGDGRTDGGADEDEYDITVDYRPPEGFFDGLWLRTRVAHVDQHGANANDFTDYRVIVNYTVPLF